MLGVRGHRLARIRSSRELAHDVGLLRGQPRLERRVPHGRQVHGWRQHLHGAGLPRPLGRAGERGRRPVRRRRPPHGARRPAPAERGRLRPGAHDLPRQQPDQDGRDGVRRRRRRHVVADVQRGTALATVDRQLLQRGHAPSQPRRHDRRLGRRLPSRAIRHHPSRATAPSSCATAGARAGATAATSTSPTSTAAWRAATTTWPSSPPARPTSTRASTSTTRSATSRSPVRTPSGTTSWGANVFTAAASEDLAAVGIYTPLPGCAYEILYAPAGGTPSFGDAAVGDVGDDAHGGVPRRPVAGDGAADLRSEVHRRLQAHRPRCRRYHYTIPVERPIATYSNATANAGESYVSTNGSTWRDLTAGHQGRQRLPQGVHASRARRPRRRSSRRRTAARTGRSAASTPITWTGTGAGTATIELEPRRRRDVDRDARSGRRTTAATPGR